MILQNWAKILLLVLFSASLYVFKHIGSVNITNEKAKNIAKIIADGSFTYLKEQNKIIILFSIIICGLFGYFFGMNSSIAFAIGALGSMWSGVIAMTISVKGNIATVSEAEHGLGRAFKMAFGCGAGASIYLNGLGLICVLGCLYYLQYSPNFLIELPKSLLGFAVGANVVSIFARLGGGIFTKGADVGADMVGKIEQSLPEDDPRNPAVIADNVGDNVGDCAGMAADLFESYVVTIVSTILYNFDFCSHVLAICVLGLLSCTIPIFLISYNDKPWNEMSKYFHICCILFVGSVFGYQYFTGISKLVTMCVTIGVICVSILLKITSYYTSSEYRPVKLVSEASKFGSGTNIIAGLAMGYESVVLPIIVVVIALICCYYIYGIFGITLCSIGIAALSPSILTMDILGPISDNAGGIAEMSGLDHSVRIVTDELDSIGNTTKAITKGYAICSAIFAIIVMFCSYSNQLANTVVGNLVFSIMDPWLFSGLLVGGIIPCLFAGMSMLSVGKAAENVVQTVRNQIKNNPGILTGKQLPDYNEVVIFLTRFAIKSMIIPTLFPIVLTVLGFIIVNKFIGIISAFTFISAILLGTAVVGILISMMMITSGGLWDNTKKLIEKQGLKKSEIHKSAVTGDTVGDPFKDTTGPSLNSVIKLVSLVCIGIVNFIQ